MTGFYNYNQLYQFSLSISIPKIQLKPMILTYVLYLFSINLLVFITSSQDCLSDSGRPQIDYMQSGFYYITNQNYQRNALMNPQKCYDVTLSYNAFPNKNYSILLSTFQINSPQSQYVDFSIRSFKRQKSFSIIVLNAINDWQSYSISYLISSRNDLLVGNYIFNAIQANGCEKKQEYQGSFYLANWARPYAPNQTLQIRLFLSGIKIQYNSNIDFVSISIKSVVLNRTTGQILFNVTNQNLNNIINIQFNYLIFSQTNFKYLYQQGSMKASASSTNNVLKFSSLYMIKGLSSYNSLSNAQNSFNIINFYQISVVCRGSKCPRTCISKRQCLSRLGKIVTAPKNGQQCLLQCGQNQIFNKNNICQCNYGFQKRNSSSTCQRIVLNLTCQQNQYINFTTRRCQCNQGFVMVSNKCEVVCNVNGFRNGSRCTCLPGFRQTIGYCHNCTLVGQGVDYVNKKCNCIQPQFYDDPNGNCIKNNCTSNFRWIQSIKACGCKQNFSNFRQVCYPNCQGVNYVNISGKCYCLDNHTYIQEKKGCYRLINNCSKPNQVKDKYGIQCVCRDGFEKVNQTVQCVIKCTNPFQVLSKDKLRCDCVSGYQRDNLSNLCKAKVPISPSLPQCKQNQIYDNRSLSCVCRQGYRLNLQSICTIVTCNQFQQYSLPLRQCLCINGYQRNSQNICQRLITQIKCPLNSLLKNQQCICNAGFFKIADTCINTCQINQVFNQKNQKCQCQQGFGKVNNVCRPCPNNSKTINDSCLCDLGLNWNISANSCQLNCKQNSIKTLIKLASQQDFYICQCLKGHAQNSRGQCQKIPDPVCPILQIPKNMFACPDRSTWDSKNYKCVCNSSSQFFINGKCGPCPSNQAWNGNNCVCLNNTNLINDKCLKCDINSVYRGGKCNCNYGYFDANTNNIENTVCKLCHSSCGTCQGELNNQCLTCSNAQATLKNGICLVDSTACAKGYYNSTQGCRQCGLYCSKCTNQDICLQCVSGFQLQRIAIMSSVTVFCPQICGDGKRFQYQCDDGNLNNGDGCDSNCLIQNGWSCNSGSATKPSICLKNSNQQQRSILTVTKPLRLIGQIAQGVTLSYLPDKLSENLCLKCDDILLVKLISYTVLPAFNVSYIPTSRFKFLIKFTFNGILAIPDFVYSVQINPKYEKLFTVQDMAQRQIVPVSPTDLALNNPQEILSLDQVSNPFNLF